ncbi:MAG: glucose-1-phosphate cytidylyltransferase [Acidobacteriota bacterium]|nr:glucose-1-phosphate cytidylyltransferase [Acidobacteriota bacterium]MDH3784726.1 glucose-1-phosphate cytidylyltransferase [Acidobacteriota bacterium]
MKVAILAGGMGTRLAEETEIRPKPMVELGGRPILWHIMKHYDSFGHREFAIGLGYKGEYIKRWFMDYAALEGSLTVQTKTAEVVTHATHSEDWSVDLIETGLHTMTGGRIKRLAPWLGESTFMLTWGDGVSDVDLDKLLAFHRSHGKLATMTAVRPAARYGHLEFDGDKVVQFTEKPQTSEGWINGAFFVLEPQIFDYIDGDNVMWEHAPLERLAGDGQLMAYKHDGFWQCMDTLREKHILENLWNSGNPPWKSWE